jgi:uroporphyrinogen decarboxylase
MPEHRPTRPDRPPLLDRLVRADGALPLCLWKHFGEDQRTGPAMVAAHLAYHRAVRPDLVKIMSDIAWPIAGVERIRRAADWARLRPTPPDHPVFAQWLGDVAAVVAGLGGAAPAVVTLFNPFCIANDHRGDIRLAPDLACRRIMADLADNQAATLHGFAMITQTLLGLLPRLTGLGIDGIFFASIGAERARFSPKAFARIIAPFDAALLAAARSATGFTILHVCGAAIDLDRYRGMAFDVANWDIGADNPGLAHGAATLASAVMGGIDAAGPLATGDVDAALRAFLDAAPAGLVVGAPGCAIAPPAPTAALAAFVSRTRKLTPGLVDQA